MDVLTTFNILNGLSCPVARSNNFQLGRDIENKLVSMYPEQISDLGEMRDGKSCHVGYMGVAD